MYPKIKKSQEWGRYFYRMICHETRDGEINPLRRLVDKVRTQAQGARTYGNVFELPVTDPALDVNTYNPACDGNLLRGGPCLMNPLIFDSSLRHVHFEEANADSYIVAIHTRPRKIERRPSMKVNDIIAAGPRWSHNALESRHKK